MNITSLQSRGIHLAAVSCLIVTLTVAPGCGSAAYAQAPNNLIYTQKKTLIFRTAIQGVPTVKVSHFEHAWYKKDKDKESAVDPAQPDPAKFDPFGYDNLLSALPENTSTKPNAKGEFPAGTTFNPVKETEVLVADDIQNETHTAEAKQPRVKAEAYATFDNVPTLPAANGVYTAQFRTDGVVVKEDGLEGYAFSHARVDYKNTGLNLKKVKVTINPNRSISGRVGTMFDPADKTAVHTKDPLSFTLYDSSDAPLLSDTVFSTLMTAANEASVNWMDSGSVIVETGPSSGFAALHLLIDSRYVEAGQGGALDLEITDGIVTESSATGAFSGFTLPAVNSAQSSVILSLPSDGFTFDLNLDPYITPQVASISLEAANIGDAYISSASVAAPEPSAAAFLLVLVLPGAGASAQRRIGLNEKR